MKSSHLWYAVALLTMGLLAGWANYAFFQAPLRQSQQIAFPFAVTAPSICPYDLVSDGSLEKYISDKTPFKNHSYVPIDLEPINSSFTANDASKFQLRKEAGVQFADMAWHFWKDFGGDKLVIVSAYRSDVLQEYLLHSFCKKNQCAQAWSSEHQAGLALDLSVKTARWWSVGLDQNNKYHDWLLDHAAEFGFENTYQKWVDIDGKRIEPRHRRYVWSQLATLLHDRQQTFAERIVSGSNQISCPGLNDIIIK